MSTSFSKPPVLDTSTPTSQEKSVERLGKLYLGAKFSFPNLSSTVCNFGFQTKEAGRARILKIEPIIRKCVGLKKDLPINNTIVKRCEITIEGLIPENAEKIKVFTDVSFETIHTYIMNIIDQSPICERRPYTKVIQN